ncbi:MAG: hypothetical protein WAK00_08690 [Microbacterium sp.]|uniref:hypothetical protein n=1 Tax=Microbacterium sp. TaxID=51671 RepID=UPI003BAF9C6B
MSEPQQPPLPPYVSGDHGYPPAAPQPAYPPAHTPQPGHPQPGHPQVGQPQPGQPQAGQIHPVYAHAGQPHPGYPAYGAPGPAAPGNPLGRAAFLIALITFGIGLLGTVAMPLLYSTTGYGAVDIITGASGLITLIAYGVALVLGVVALRRPAPHLLAGIAIGIAGSGVIGTTVAWMATFLYRFI